MIKAAKVFAVAIMPVFLCLISAERLDAAEEYYREAIAIDWERDQFDMYRYTDSYLREYEYYFIDYMIKENPGQSVWKSQIITITYVNPDYVVIHEVHNYFMISHYFSHEKIVHHVNQEDYSISPYQMLGGDLQYIRRFNTMLSKIRLILAGEGDQEYVNGDKRQQDIFYLDSARKFMY
jgi:hypothetical protein